MSEGKHYLIVVKTRADVYEAVHIIGMLRLAVAPVRVDYTNTHIGDDRWEVEALDDLDPKRFRGITLDDVFYLTRPIPREIFWALEECISSRRVGRRRPTAMSALRTRPDDGWSAAQAGEKHACDDCGKLGEVQLDPYEEEINKLKVWVCLCDKCYEKWRDEI